LNYGILCVIEQLHPFK